MEVQTGKVLTESGADLKLPMASTTKIMTALIIAEDCDLDEVFTVPDEAVGVEGSSIYLKKGEKIDVRDLLYGLMLRSGNDSAAALAIHHSGSIVKFAEKMNERAKQLGATSTNFKNPSGLPDSQHYTTARDLCKIACAAMKNKIFKEVVGTKNYEGKFRSYSNKNKMLFNYQWATGVKTGYTKNAGRCLVSSAEKDGMEVVSVVLNCPEMYERSESILNYCFSNYKLIKLDENRLFMCGEVLCKIDKSKYFVVKSNENIDFKTVRENNSKRILSGEFVGKLEILSENGLISTEKLYSI